MATSASGLYDGNLEGCSDLSAFTGLSPWHSWFDTRSGSGLGLHRGYQLKGIRCSVSRYTRSLRIYHAAFPRCFPCTCLSGSADGKFVSKTSHIHRASKKVMPLMIKLYMRFTNDIEIYADGTLEASHRSVLPHQILAEIFLWKTATTSFLQIVTDSVRRMVAFCDRISDM
ncbi:hypothetical protein M405DRAFT_67957 [Rhizopogon salebrosus TDB-379]|nr:hypothetical protein M405DRAFT_67957 [Rhizopogon salebrosus TDB-379]